MTDSFGTVSALPQKEAKIYLEDMPEQGNVEGIPYHAKSPNDCVDPRDLDTQIIGHCERFDLNNKEDRESYADLSAKLTANYNYELQFEQRVTMSDTLIIYLSYLEYIKIAKG